MKNKIPSGFSLAELLAAIIIGSMVMIAALTIYNRVQNASASVLARVDKDRLPQEVLQLIAEDIDDILSYDPDIRIIIPENKVEEMYSSARLEILKTFQGPEDPREENKETFEQIIWQTGVDYDAVQEGLVLYRSFSGMTEEDRLLDIKREEWEEDYTFVPVCSGVTFFSVEAVVGEDVVSEWDDPALPNGIKITVSFAEPEESDSGVFVVPEESKFSRTIAVDRTRKIKFDIIKEPNEVQEND
ncbi:MAG: prepilin-type N-terminal cleavage/methylation domain-containing protein [Phycisphaerae bacterium]|nr:prepilin-type N-terminal cleavage/methylation domain-containing protein [Phycisphaerae bacterium]